MKAYHAFLVRCWQEEENARSHASGWRFIVLEIGGPRVQARGFADFSQLVLYLSHQIASGTFSAPLATPQEGEEDGEPD